MRLNFTSHSVDKSSKYCNALMLVMKQSMLMKQMYSTLQVCCEIMRASTEVHY